jgi:hypothetical protein
MPLKDTQKDTGILTKAWKKTQCVFCRDNYDTTDEHGDKTRPQLPPEHAATRDEPQVPESALWPTSDTVPLTGESDEAQVSQPAQHLQDQHFRNPLSPSASTTTFKQQIDESIPLPSKPGLSASESINKPSELPTSQTGTAVVEHASNAPLPPSLLQTPASSVHEPPLLTSAPSEKPLYGVSKGPTALFNRIRWAKPEGPVVDSLSTELIVDTRQKRLLVPVLEAATLTTRRRSAPSEIKYKELRQALLGEKPSDITKKHNLRLLLLFVVSSNTTYNILEIIEQGMVLPRFSQFFCLLLRRSSYSS